VEVQEHRDDKDYTRTKFHELRIKEWQPQNTFDNTERVVVGTKVWTLDLSGSASPSTASFSARWCGTRSEMTDLNEMIFGTGATFSLASQRR